MIFKKVFSGLALILLLTFSADTFGQSQNPAVTDVTVSLLGWVKHLNNDVDKYYSREKATELQQHLEYLKQDLGNYMKMRKRLSDSLFRNTITPGKKDINNLEDLKTSMSAVMQQVRGVADLVSTQLQTEGDNMNNEIYDVLYGQQTRFLSNLEAFLAGGDVTKRDLAVEGSASYSRLEECINLITALESKIDKKIKK